MRTIGENQAAVDDEIENLAAERGSVETELGSLVGEEESSALRMRRNLVDEQIRATPESGPNMPSPSSC